MASVHNIRVFVGPDPKVGGNPAPVWLDADDLSSAQMQEYTRRSGHESVFVLKPVTPDAFQAQIRSDIQLWGGIARSVNAKAE